MVTMFENTFLVLTNVVLGLILVWVDVNTTSANWLLLLLTYRSDNNNLKNMFLCGMWYE